MQDQDAMMIGGLGVEFGVGDSTILGGRRDSLDRECFIVCEEAEGKRMKFGGWWSTFIIDGGGPLECENICVSLMSRFHCVNRRPPFWAMANTSSNILCCLMSRPPLQTWVAKRCL